MALCWIVCPDNAPVAMMLDVGRGPLSGEPQIPVKPLTMHVHGERLWENWGTQKNVFQFIPPELALCRQTSCDDEHLGRYVGGLQQRLCMVEIVGIAVVERDGDRATEGFLFSHCMVERSEGHRAGVSPQDLQMLGKMLPGYGKKQWIRFQFCDAVVEQDDRSANGRIPVNQAYVIVLSVRNVRHWELPGFAGP